MSSKNFSRLILVLVVILIAFYIVKRITSPKKFQKEAVFLGCLLYTSPSPRDRQNIFMSRDDS